MLADKVSDDLFCLYTCDAVVVVQVINDQCIGLLKEND